MRRIFLSGLLMMSQWLGAQQTGYEIKVRFQPFRNAYIYLGHYFGKSYPIIDSALLNNEGEAVFRGSQKLNGGIYLVGYPGRNGFFEILVDKDQHFTVLADTATLANGISFINSPDNELFNRYKQYMTQQGTAIQAARQRLGEALNPADSAAIQAELSVLDRQILQYRLGLIRDHAGTLMATLLQCMREPELTEELKSPRNREDSAAAWQYVKSRFWDGVNFWDGRLAYTPFFEDKLDKYFNQLVSPHPDSVIRELDWMLGYASINEEMNRFLLLKFVNRYLNQKYMWEDKVFIHLYEKFFSNKKYPWLNERGEKIITDRAYSLMANIMGSEAAEIELPDSSGKRQSLYSQSAPFHVVVFWDPTCGHCKEVLPKMDSLYRGKWQQQGVKIYSVAKETQGTREDWTRYLTEQKLWDWTQVYYSKAEEKARVEANIPGYSQLYDVQSFPTLYLLDGEKRIVAKKLSLEQIDDVLQIRIKGEN